MRDLVPVAYGLAQDVYPEWLDRDVNGFPAWLPIWAPQPRWTKPPGAPRATRRFSPAYHREYRCRKELSAILAVRYELGPGGLARLLEDDGACVDYLQRFLAEHEVAVPFPLYDEMGRYVLAAPAKAKVLAGAILKAVTQAKDNELFVLCIDLLEMTDEIADLERAVCVARARHHQVIAICPWPAGVRVPGVKMNENTGPFDVRLALAQLATARLHEAFAKVQHALGRFRRSGAVRGPIRCGRAGFAAHAPPAHPGTGRPMSEATPVRRITQRHYQALGGLALAAIFLLQLQHSSGLQEGALLANLFVLLLGAVGLLYRVRLSPILVLCAIAAPIVAEHYNRHQFNLDFRSSRILDVADVLLCVAILTYLTAQYRLHGLRFGVLPADPRCQRRSRLARRRRCRRRSCSA